MPATRYCTEDFLSGATLGQIDETVAEIFGVMLGLETAYDAAPLAETSTGEGHRTGIIGFSGALRGSCEVRMDTKAARIVASAMLGGSPLDEGDGESIDDAVGELGNMLAGGWKNRVESLSGKCFLSPPTVISGSSYHIHSQHPASKIIRSYLFDGHSIQITINCVEIGA